MPANLENSAVAKDWKRSVFIPIPKKGNAKECSNYCRIVPISHASEVMLKILQVRLQQYVNRELPDVQAGFRKGRGTRDKTANIRWIIEKAREFQKNRVRLFATQWTEACQSPKPSTVSWGLLKFMSIESVMPSNHLIFCRPLLLPPSICPSIKVFSNELALCIRWSETRCTSLELQLELEAIFSDFRATAVSVRSGSQHPFIQQLY